MNVGLLPADLAQMGLVLPPWRKPNRRKGVFRQCQEAEEKYGRLVRVVLSRCVVPGE